MVSSGIALIGSSLIGMSLSKYYLLTLALNGTAGIAAGFLNVFCNTMLGFFWGERVGMFMQLLHFSFGVGSVVAPLIVTCVTKVMGGEIRTNLWDSLTVTYMVASLLWLISIGIFAFSPEMNARKELSDESIQADLAEIAVPDQPEEKVVEDSTKPIARLRKKLTRKFVMKTLGFFLVSLVLFFYTEGIFGGLLFTYVTLKGLTDEAGAGLINSLFWLCFTCGRLVGIPVSSKVKPIYMIIFDLFGSLSAMTAMLVFRGNLTVFTVATGVLGFSYASQYPATMSLPSSFMGLKMDGMVTSLIILGPSLGGMTMPLAITSSFGVFGADGLLYGITLLCGISTFIYVIMLAFFKKKQPPVQPVQVAAVEVDVK
jgi:fucose permease